MILTSYFANIRNLPDNCEPIAICGKRPDSYTGKYVTYLAPKKYFFNIWRETRDNEYYIKHFNEEVLSVLDPKTVESWLLTMANGKIPVLICYEKPGNFCHRHLVAKWLNDANIECKEFVKDESKN